MLRSRPWQDIPDYPDYNERVVYQELDTETRVTKNTPPTRLVEISNETAQFLKKKCSKRQEGADRLSTRNVYALPKVLATKSSVLDAHLKPESVKAADKELCSIQSAVLDAMAPLTSIVKADAKGDNVTHKQAVNAARAAIELVGNANARINHMREQRSSLR